jgi:hypothetical protein
MTTAYICEPSSDVNVAVAILFSSISDYLKKISFVQQINAITFLQETERLILTGQHVRNKVDIFISSEKGKLLAQNKDTKHLLFLLQAICFIQEKDWERAHIYLEKAQDNPLTKLPAISLRTMVFEYQGDTGQADTFLKLFSEQLKFGSQVRVMYLCLIYINIESWVLAFTKQENDVALKALENRVIALDQEGKELGWQDIDESAFLMFKAFLTENFNEFWGYLGLRRGLNSEKKKLANQGLNIFLHQFELDTHGYATDSLNKFIKTYHELVKSRRDLLKSELRRYLTLPDEWDGPESRCPEKKAIDNAFHFIDLLPRGIPLPKPMLSPYGEVGLYWDVGDIYADVAFEGEADLSLFIRNRGMEETEQFVEMGIFDVHTASLGKILSPLMLE